MFEAYLIIAAAIFTALVGHSIIWFALMMNEKFIKAYTKAIMNASKETLTEINEETEKELERFRWTENC